MKIAGLVLSLLLSIASQGLSGKSPDEVGSGTDDFLSEFDLVSLRGAKLPDEVMFILRLGWSGGGEGQLVQVKIVAGRVAQVTAMTLTGEGGLEVNKPVNLDKNFTKMVDRRLESLQVRMVTMIESYEIAQSLHPKVWIFEYIDPLGGMVSQISLGSDWKGTTEKPVEGEVPAEDSLEDLFSELWKHGGGIQNAGE